MELVFISFLIVYIIDLSGFIDNLKEFLWNRLYRVKYNPNWRIKPFDCSLCTTWWVGLIYILFTGFSFHRLLLIALLSFLTPQIKDLLLALQRVIQEIINWIWEW